MQIAEAEELNEGDEVYLLDGVGRINKESVVHYLAGPFKAGYSLSSSYVLVARNPRNSKAEVYNLSDLAAKPPVPKVGETWIHRVDGTLRTRYIDDVTERYVITKSDPGKPDSKAHLMTRDDLTTNFRRKS